MDIIYIYYTILINTIYMYKLWIILQGYISFFPRTLLSGLSKGQGINYAEATGL